jgi:hypothetical protein
MHEIVRVMKANNGPDPLRDVLARFPDSEGRIRELFQEDEQFRELCADYGECMAALRRLRKQGAARDDRIEQYAEMRACLEQELSGRISAATGG